MTKTLLLKQCLLAAALGSSLCGIAQTITVSNCNLNGWTTYTEPTGALSFVNGPATPPAGKGSLLFTLGTDGNGKAAIGYNGYAGTKLSDFTQLSYSTYVQANNSGQAPALELAIDLNGNGTPEDRLVFEPVYQTGNYPGVIQNGGQVTLNTWQKWNGMTGGWWAQSDPLSGPSTYTLASFLQQYPNATIADVPNFGGVVLTGGGGNTWDNFIGNADALTIGTTSTTRTFDFEPCSQGGATVTLCHKGKPLTVAPNAVAAHLRHGDQLGACPVAGAVTAVSDHTNEVQDSRFEVRNYPNPFATTTRIRYSLPLSSTVTLKVFDAAGRTVYTLVEGLRTAGTYLVDFDASRLGKGVYYYTLQAETRAGRQVQTGSMTVIR